MVDRTKKTMDGNEAAAYVSYAYTEVAGIYPITPSSPMADHVDIWAAGGMKNVFGRPVTVVEMQSEGGASGTVHGSLAAGALTTTYTASQGLLLMIPNMYKIAGELLPAVFHVSARTVASHALSIFGDHSDIYACRQTGFAMLAETNVQEVMDLSPVAHLAAIESRVPFLNFFDGFRTSHELRKIDVWDFKDLGEMLNMDAVDAFRKRALNPTHPVMRGSHENGDIFFQNREAVNKYYDAVPQTVEKYMDKVNEKLGTDYKLFNYYGAPDADRVIIAMGSVCDVAEEVIDYLTAKGEKVGLVKVRLYRPFCADKLIEAIPETAEKIAVLDRTKEPGALGEPLYMDVVTAFATHGVKKNVIGGRYGLGSKDTPPSSIFAVFLEMQKDAPAERFTIGIDDDVTHLSLPEMPAPITAAKGTIECKFWGLGGDGTVGANKNSIKIIGDHTDKYVQAYFQYDSKKTMGVTVSHLRFGDDPIKSSYYVNKADFVACHNPSYLEKGIRIVNDVKPGGTFLINCRWSGEELGEHLNAETKRYIARNKINLYIIDAIDLAAKVGMGKRTNTVLQSAFFSLAKVLPAEDAIRYMKEAATKSYMKKGQEIVDNNHKAIDAGATAYVKVEVPESWSDAVDEPKKLFTKGEKELVDMVNEITMPVGAMNGDSLPVSAFEKHADGTFLQGASAYEKRGVAVNVPRWNNETCIKCNQCAYVCPHAAIRPFALTKQETENAPKDIKLSPKPIVKTEYNYTLSVSAYDCMGCTLCAGICPTKSLTMVPREEEEHMQGVFDYCVQKVTQKDDVASNKTVISSQYKKPLLEFSGSCAGCAETSYARLITQLFGDRMYISNATGCSSIWGGPAGTSPFTRNAEGRGPTWANSLFEDNAEHGFGMYLGQKVIRERLAQKVEALASSDAASEGFRSAADRYFETYDNGNENGEATKKLIEELSKLDCAEKDEILASKEYLDKKSVWIFGGDGWAYDIGFGGLDHVLASGEDVNVMVFDTEVYSNTGGQASKASRLGQVAQFASAGKEMKKKSLADIAMTYGYIYVAQIAMGANLNQTLKALNEAEAYHGPSLVIGYAPCEMHSIKGGMANCQNEMKKAVACGYWNMFRFNPDLKKEGKDPFILDSKAPEMTDYRAFLMNEARYARLTKSFPERAEELFDKSEKTASSRYDYLLKLKEFYAKDNK